MWVEHHYDWPMQKFDALIVEPTELQPWHLVYTRKVDGDCGFHPWLLPGGPPLERSTIHIHNMALCTKKNFPLIDVKLDVCSFLLSYLNLHASCKVRQSSSQIHPLVFNIQTSSHMYPKYCLLVFQCIHDVILCTHHTPAPCIHCTLSNLQKVHRVYAYEFNV